MKRLILPAIVGMASTSALAQSQVTVYGAVDMGIERANGGSTNTPAGTTNGNAAARSFPQNSTWTVAQGFFSRLGFMGREDLSDGMYARFDIQHRFNPDTGNPSAGAPFWAGRSVVALGSARYGELYLGREYTPISYVGIAADPTGWSYVSRLDATFTNAGYGAGSTTDQSYFRHNNMLGYRSPTVGGLKGEFFVAASESAAQKRALGGSMTYSSGPVFVMAGFDAMGRADRAYAITAAYDFGFIRPTINFADARGGFVNNAAGGVASPGYRAKSWSASATMPLGTGRLFVSAGWYDPTSSGVLPAATAGTRSTATKFAGGYFYSLSKQTQLYATAGTARKASLGAASFSRSTAFDIGITKFF